jgi:hypothetical protein
MKLKDILHELQLEKGTWVPIPHEELPDYEKQIFDLITTAYKELGGNLKFRSPADIFDPRKEYEVIDLDNDQQPNALSVSKQTPAGTKFVGTGHDGTKQAKRAVVQHKAELLRHPGYYIEASGRIKDILHAYKIAVVANEADVVKALGGKAIEWHGDGTYTREINGERVEKMMFGKPRV